jgi:hypothetical protein
LRSWKWNQLAAANLFKRNLALCHFLFYEAQLVVLEKNSLVDFGFDDGAQVIRADLCFRFAPRVALRRVHWRLHFQGS